MKNVVSGWPGLSASLCAGQRANLRGGLCVSLRVSLRAGLRTGLPAAFCLVCALPPVLAQSSANTQGSTSTLAAAQAASDDAPAVTHLGIARALDAVLERALSLRGTRYRAGGSSPETGFDCSGFVGFLYRDMVGFQLPRSAHEIWRFGKTVERSDLQPGDLVFYNTMKRPYSHVGIYLGGNQFVHAPASGGSVRVVNMDERYWATRWNGAKRVAQ